LRLQGLLPDHVVRERSGAHGQPRGPPPRPVRALRPLRRPLQHPRRRRPLGERLHLRREGFGPRGVKSLAALAGKSAAAPPVKSLAALAENRKSYIPLLLSFTLYRARSARLPSERSERLHPRRSRASRSSGGSGALRT